MSWNEIQSNRRRLERERGTIIKDWGGKVPQIQKDSIVTDGMNNAQMSGEYFEAILRAGINATMIPVSITATFRQTVERLKNLLKLVDENRDKVAIIRRAGEITEAKRQGKVGLILVLEDCRQIDDDLDLIRVYWEAGIRRMQVVYVMQNSMGCGKGERHDSGLTKLGVAAIERMEKQGMLIDLCHCADKTFREAMAVVSRPVVLSHANLSGVYAHPNNVTDEQMEMVARNGGVIGVAAVPFYVAKSNPNLEQVIDHIDYVKKRIGIDHVGIGLAIFEGHPLSFYEQFNLPKDIYGKPPWAWPQGIETIELFPNITQKLIERGYSNDDIRKVLGGNFLRVFQQVWA